MAAKHRLELLSFMHPDEAAVVVVSVLIAGASCDHEQLRRCSTSRACLRPSGWLLRRGKCDSAGERRRSSSARPGRPADRYRPSEHLSASSCTRRRAAISHMRRLQWNSSGHARPQRRQRRICWPMPLPGQAHRSIMAANHRLDLLWSMHPDEAVAAVASAFIAGASS